MKGNSAGQLLVAIDDYDGWPTLKAALQFLALTCAFKEKQTARQLPMQL